MTIALHQRIERLLRGPLRRYLTPADRLRPQPHRRGAKTIGDTQ